MPAHRLLPLLQRPWRRRNGTRWVDAVTPNGERVRRTTGIGNRALALEFHDKSKAELWRIVRLGDKPQRTRWSQVDVVRRIAWIHPDQAKARKAIPVPLNLEAVTLIRKNLGRHATHVFSFRGKPITQVSTKAWYAALQRAGIEDFRWHDLRHTWASWHVQNGTPLFVLQEMGGWESAEMVRRYAHLAADHLAPYAEQLGTLRTGDSANCHRPAYRRQR